MRSPFKLLDAYAKEDRSQFFGRDEELEDLFQHVFKSNLLLVYGASGTGKTSMVLCGLMSQFSEDSCHAIYVRRAGTFTESWLKAIDNHAVTKMQPDDLEPGRPEIVQRVEGLYWDQFKPLYFVFDQLEELFILGTENERAQFFKAVADVSAAKLHCHITLIIREEYFAALSSAEAIIPSLFANRVRIERMRIRNAETVVLNTCSLSGLIFMPDPAEFAFTLLAKLSEDGHTIELTYLQVYLDRLFRIAQMQGGRKRFDLELLERSGSVTNILSQFLEEQVSSVDNPRRAWQILKVLVTRQGTKRSMSVAGILRELGDAADGLSQADVMNYILHFEKAKILVELEDRPGYYEFAHDSLAESTFQKLDADEKVRMEAASLIQNAFEAYTKRSVMMSKADVQFVQPILSKLSLSAEVRSFVLASSRIHRNRRRIAVLAGVVFATVLTLTTVVAVNAAYRARVAEKEAIGALRKAEDAQQDAENAQKDAEDAQKAAQNAKKDAEESRDSMKTEFLRRHELEFQLEIDKLHTFRDAGYLENYRILLDSLRKDTHSACKLKIADLK